MINTADEAFDKLLGKNALGIPVANPAPEARSEAGPSADAVPVPVAAPVPAPAAVPAVPAGAAPVPTVPLHSVPSPAVALPPTVSFMNGSVGGGMSEAMRVLDLLDSSGGDYNPRDYGPDDGDRLFTTPTEMDLDPVDADPELPPPRRSTRRTPRNGVRAKDETPAPAPVKVEIEAEAEADRVDVAVDEEESAAGTVAGEPESEFAVDAELRKARRFRRFSYLPLGGMEHFENRARDIMASLASQEPDRPSLAVTCPFRGDGQAEVAIRLSLAMARRVGYRVLLADFNIREPQIALRLGLSSKYFTLSDILRGSCPLGEALMVSEEDNLYVLPARATDRVGDEVLNDRQVQALMAKIHANFDFTVISCGSADHADAAIACRHAGATALAAYCRKSSAQAVREAADNLADAGAHIVGMLLTGT